MTKSQLQQTREPGITLLKTGMHTLVIRARASSEGDSIVYSWDYSYFERKRLSEPPWAHFSTDFVCYHRPLSDYWKAFRAGGFDIADFEQPRISEERYHLASTNHQLEKSKNRPYSVAFKLVKAT